MKRIVFHEYGGPEKLVIEEAPDPSPREGEVLVQLKAASVNPLDWKLREGAFSFIPMQKFPHAIGGDFSGVVESVGVGVSGFRAGQAVIGWMNPMAGGAYAEKVVVRETSLVEKPEGIGFQEAACIPVVGIAALQGLCDVGRLARGQKVLVYGCSGGVGLFAVPIAKAMGAYVVGVCGPSGMDVAQTLGADQILDFHGLDLDALGISFDVIFDLSGKLPFDEAKKALCPHGIYVDPSPTPAVMAGSVINNLFHAQQHGILMSKPNVRDLQTLVDHVLRGDVRVVVAAEFPLEEAAEGHRLGQAGGVVGKIVLNVD